MKLRLLRINKSLFIPPFNHFSILCVSNNACFNFSNALSNKSQFLTKNPLRQIELFALNPLKENLDDEADREK